MDVKTSDHPGLSKFVCKATEALETHHPNWRKMLTNDRLTETLCIPDCLDLCEGRYHLSTHFDETATKISDRVNSIKGDNGEDEFLRAFRQLNIGGILLGGFDSKELFDKIKRQKLPISFKGPLQKPDFIFFHFAIGMIIIEVKGADRNQEFPTKSFAQSIKQVNDRRKWMPEIFKLICDTEFVVEKNLHFAICYPFFDFSSYSREIQKVPHWCHFISKSDHTTLEEAMIDELLKLVQKDVAIYSLKPYENLVAALTYGSKSVVELSHTSNAIKLYNKIASQDYLNDRKWATNEEREAARSLTINDFNEATPFFLNKEQMEALEWYEKNDANRVQVITGLPGTGKTLVLMLQALKTSREKRSGNVVIQLYLEKDLPLMKKFKQFFPKNTDCLSKSRIVFGTNNYTCAAEDDLFLDENYFRSEIVSLLKARTQCIGRTTFILNGCADPTNVVNITAALSSIHHQNFHISDLRTVVRGTKRIIDEWSDHIPDLYTKRIGHKITGADVKKIKCATVPGCLNAVISQIESLISNDKSKDSNIAFQSRHMAVIAENYNSSCLLLNLLKQKDIPCGSCEEQIEDSSLIAVSADFDSCSLEWPVVIAVLLEGLESDAGLLLIKSRAMVKLIIIEIDSFALSNAADKVFEGYFENSLSNKEVQQTSRLIYEMLLSSSKRCSDELRVAETIRKDASGTPSLTKALEEDIDCRIDGFLRAQSWLAIFRHNYVVKDVEEMPFLGNPDSFMECIKEFSDNYLLCSYFIYRYSSHSHFGYKGTRHCSMKTVNKVPNIFTRIWSGKCDETEVNVRWKLICKLFERLRYLRQYVQFLQYLEKLATHEFLQSMSDFVFNNQISTDFTRPNRNDYLSPLKAIDIKEDDTTAAFDITRNQIILGLLLRRQKMMHCPHAGDTLYYCLTYLNTAGTDMKEIQETFDSEEERDRLLRGCQWFFSCFQTILLAVGIQYE